MKDNYNTMLNRWKALIKKPSTLIVGIDIAKDIHVGCLGTRDEVFIRKFPFTNNLKGFEALILTTREVAKTQHIQNVIFGVEPTSIYWKPLYGYLTKRDYTICLVNPVAVSNNRKTMTQDTGKTDPKDAYAILDLISQRKMFFPVQGPKKYEFGKLLLKNWTNSQESIIRSKNRIRSYLNLTFPELDSEITNLDSKSALKFLAKYSTVNKITRLSRSDFSRNKTIKPIGWNIEKLEKIHDLASDSIGVQLYKDKGNLILNELVKDLNETLARENYWCGKCEALACTINGFENIIEIKGLGMKTTTGILLSIGDCNSFSNAKQITKYAGLNLIERKSGTSINGLSMISHQGNAKLRYWAYQGALHVINYPGLFKTFYERKKKNSPGNGSGKRALVAVSDKLLRVIWAMLKGGENCSFKNK